MKIRSRRARTAPEPLLAFVLLKPYSGRYNRSVMRGMYRFTKYTLSALVVLAAPVDMLWSGDRASRFTTQPDVRSERGPRGHQFVTRSPRRCGIRFTHCVRNVSDGALEDVEVVVAVPVSGARQDIHETYFEPRPSQIAYDASGQRTATFRLGTLPPHGEARVELTVDATLWELQWLISERDLGSASEIPDSVLRRYLRDGSDYRIEEAILQRAAERVGTPDGGILEQVRRVHDFVIDSLDYERDARWDPADTVLRRGRGSCSEYSYLMIALCRLHGVPARYAGGTWIDTAEDDAGEEALAGGVLHVDRVFHRWVEVYLPRLGWFPIDPTRDDRASEEGAPYRYFGRLPWSCLAFYRGDGAERLGNRLGSDYRSSTRWRGSSEATDDRVVVERYAVWSDKQSEGIVTARAALGD